jgi:hypothetical protein
MESKGVSVVLCLPGNDQKLKARLYVMHCHMMNHEELGMMQSVEVYNEADGPVGFAGGEICSSTKK